MKRFWTKNYDPGVPEDYDHNILITDLIEQSLKNGGQKKAITNFGISMTFEELDAMSLKLARILRSKYKEQTPIAVMLPNLLQYPVLLLAILRANCIVVNINPLYTSRELLYQLKDSQAEALFIFEGSAYTLDPVLKDLSLKEVVICRLGDLLSWKGYFYNFFYKIQPYEKKHKFFFIDYLNQEAPSFTRNLTLESLAFLQYTGGTTGPSKGAMLTQKNIANNVIQTLLWSKSLLKEGEEVIITPLPLYHIFSLTANFFFFLGLLSENVLITNPKDLESFIKLLKNKKFTVMTGVSTLFKGLITHKKFSSLDFSSVKFFLAGGMTLDPTLAQLWQSKTKVVLLEGYGLTECSPVVCAQPFTSKKHEGYVGLAYPGTDIDIRDEKGQSLAIGEVGELCVKGPQVMKGYWNKPEETAKIFTHDGYLKTGDMAFLSEEGQIKIVDRKKEMIVVSGFKIFPSEIEQLFLSQEQVLECALIGRVSEKTGEEPVLYLVLKKPWSQEEILAFAKENLVAYKVPKEIIIKESLPKSNVGKILKRELK